MLTEQSPLTPAQIERVRVLSRRPFHGGTKSMWACRDCVRAIERADEEAKYRAARLEFERSG